MSRPPSPLPVDAVLPELLAALRQRRTAVLQAPPGAGKTTRVPPALLGAVRGRILVLEPRRLAARAAARRMAFERGESVGQTVGYRVRGESQTSGATRIEVVTEGILTRMLLADPGLDGVGAVVFDEVHERSLAGDLGLALAIQARELLRPDLWILAMSATLDGERFAKLLGEGVSGPSPVANTASGGSASPHPSLSRIPHPSSLAPIITAEGRAFPVETVHLGPPQDRRRTPEAVAAAVHRALSEGASGAGTGVLAFLPGAGEIRQTEEILARGLPRDVDLHALYGALPPAEQDAAVAPAPRQRRKVVLATSIAETSLTIDGVVAVVDAGLARRPRFSPATGMQRLETVRVSRAEADQRRGRAGRTAPGVAYRLWSEAETAALQDFAPPEILRADLAPLALDLASWGAAPDELRWLDPPPETQFETARGLLRMLGALDDAGALTDHGRAMARLPVHPRLAHMLIASGSPLAADVAAILGERDILRSSGPKAPDADLGLRLDALRSRDALRSFRGLSVARGALHAARKEAGRLQRLASAPRGHADTRDAGRVLALAYPDRVAQRTAETPREVRYRLREGHTAILPATDPLADHEWLAVASLDDRVGAARIFLAAPLAPEDLEELFADQIIRESVVAWDDDGGRVSARKVERLGALILSEGPLAKPDPEAVQAALWDGVRARGLGALRWSKEATRLRQRLAFLFFHDDAAPEASGKSAWPDVSDDSLLDSLSDWLAPFARGAKSLGDLARADLHTALDALIPWDRRRDLDRLAPERLPVASGANIALDYSTPEAPVLAVKLQETFGMEDTPRVLGGRVPVVMHLLSPARRPVQVTTDLASFWREGYFDVRKDLRGRYPKHPWPEDPLTATATARTKRRR
ncbi:ATP-dependent helicase HrpB [Rubricoccus marinus]|uniref:RNA helicase n=1 Tax=Rubricoccus marinus TaxID=716817 RepID=A0A259U3E9_9BACT|nr:ATP-dependent helicase HrpB [Rubricoccus marinus]